MADGAIDIITIAREYGAGGSELATALGERLGWRVLDRDLVQMVAERLRLDPRAVEAMDEHPPTLLARVAAMMHVAPADAPVVFDRSDLLSPDAVADAACAVVTEAVQSPPVIIVGHGGQCLLGRRAGTLHVRLVAPVESRAARIAARDGCDAGAAAARARETDEARRAYIRRYHRADWHDSLLYDLQFNTGRVPISEAADAVTALVHARAGVAARQAPARVR